MKLKPPHVRYTLCKDNGCLPSKPTQRAPSVRPRKSIHSDPGHRNHTVCGSLVTLKSGYYSFSSVWVNYTSIFLICQVKSVNYFKLSFPILSVKRAIHYRLGYVLGAYLLRFVKVGNGSRHSENSVVTSRRKAKGFKRVTHKL